MSGDVAELERAVDEVPQGWKVQPLSKLCGEVTERVDPAAMNGDLCGHYIGLEHIGQGTGQLEGIGKATDVVSQKSRFHAGDILYGKLRPNLRKVARPDFGGVCSTDIIVLRAKPVADPAFLFQVLQSEPLVAHAVATAAGTKMPRTHARSILSFEIASPPLDEQRRIAEVLRSVDEAIAANEAAAEQASRVYQAALTELIGSAPDQWETVRLGKIADLTLGKMLDKEKNRGELRPYLANINVRWGAFDLHDLRHMRFEERELDRYGLRYGDIIMCEGGEPGRCALWTDEAPGMMIQKALHRIRPNEGVDNHYLYYALVHSVRSGRCDEYMTGSGIKHLPGNQLAQVEVSLPSFDEQQRIAEVLRLLEQAATARQSATEQARRIKSNLMSNLLSGRVRVPA